MSRREQLEQLLQADPDDVFLQYALAMELAKEGDRAAALVQLDRVLSADANYVAAYFQKGQILAEAGESEAARQVVTQGIEVARNTGDAHAAEEMTGFLETL